jgi:hypothetical protein
MAFINVSISVPKLTSGPVTGDVVTETGVTSVGGKDVEVEASAETFQSGSDLIDGL